MFSRTCFAYRPALLWIAVAVSSSLTFADDATLEPNVAPEGFTALFNGKDLAGWCGRGHVHPKTFGELDDAEREKRQTKADADLAKHWKVEEGEIVNDGHGVFCTTTGEYGDFELLVDWKMVAPDTDSGIYLRGSPQVQIWDPHNKPQHQIGEHLGSGGLWNNNAKSPGKDPLEKADSPVGEWNTLRILLVDDHATIHLNGTLVVDDAVMHNFWDRKIKLYARGVIQLQTHGGEMRFRNIFLREIKDDGEAASVIDPPRRAAGIGTAEPYTATIPGTEVTFDMLPIPAGEFLMGSPADEEGRNDDEGPQVQVRVEPFWMGKYEVTWAEYHEFMELCNIFDKFNDLGIRTVTDDNRVDAVTAPSKLHSPNFTYQPGEAPDQPAVSMSQFAAMQYTKWLSLLTGKFYRLPTEAEWEYSCRAGTTTPFSFGDDPAAMDEHGWYYENSDDPVTGHVGTLKPNPWGLYDMHGNAAEWVFGQYDPEAYSKWTSGIVAAEAYIPTTTQYPRVARGGSWDTDPAEDCRSATRLVCDKEWNLMDPQVPQSVFFLASDKGQQVGFRIVRPVNPPPRSEWSRYWDTPVVRILEIANHRIEEQGTGEWGLVDPDLPAAIKKLEEAE